MPDSRMIHLVRHGETEWNKSGRFQGQLDIALSKLGVQQAEAVAGYLESFSISRCIASDLQRAYETAQIISEKFGIPVQAERALREVNLGSLEGEYIETVTNAISQENQYNNRYDIRSHAPNGESTLDVYHRCKKFLNTQSGDDWGNPEGDVLIVAHNGSLGPIMAILLGLSAESSRCFRFKNCAVSTVELRDSVPSLLVRYNESYHLEELQTI